MKLADHYSELIRNHNDNLNSQYTKTAPCYSVFIRPHGLLLMRNISCYPCMLSGRVRALGGFNHFKLSPSKIRIKCRASPLADCQRVTEMGSAQCQGPARGPRRQLRWVTGWNTSGTSASAVLGKEVLAQRPCSGAVAYGVRRRRRSSSSSGADSMMLEHDDTGTWKALPVPNCLALATIPRLLLVVHAVPLHSSCLGVQREQQGVMYAQLEYYCTIGSYHVTVVYSYYLL